MHKIDPMNRERGTAVLVDFCHTNFKFWRKLYPPGIRLVAKFNSYFSTYQYLHQVQWGQHSLLQCNFQSTEAFRPSSYEDCCQQLWRKMPAAMKIAARSNEDNCWELWRLLPAAMKIATNRWCWRLLPGIKMTFVQRTVVQGDLCPKRHLSIWQLCMETFSK